MGPCPFRHGYNDSDYTFPSLSCASMGPCPFRHGYVFGIANGSEITTMLQWGHALSGMDMGWLAWSVLGDQMSFNGAMPFQAWI